MMDLFTYKYSALKSAQINSYGHLASYSISPQITASFYGAIEHAYAENLITVNLLVSS